MARFKRRIRKALIADGSTTNVTIPITPSVVSGFTVAFWVNPTTVVNNARILDWQDGGPINGFTIIQQTNKNINLQTHNGSTQTANISCGHYPQGMWNHLAITHDGTIATTYLNGVQVAQDTSSGMAAAAATLTLAKRAGASNFFKGKLREFVFCNGVVLTSTQITDLMKSGTLPSGTTVYYEFKDNVIDGSGGGNNGTATGDNYEISTFPIKTPLGSNKALDFLPVTASRVVVTDTSVLQIETNETFSWFARVFIRNLSVNLLPRIIQKTPHYLCWMGDQTNTRCNQVAFEIDDASASPAEYWGTTKLTPNRWYDIGCSFNAGTGKIYIDGVSDVVTVINGPYTAPLDSTSGNNLIIGNSSTNDRPCGGFIKDVRQYNVVLTDDEFASLSTGVNVTRGLVGKWNFDEGSGSTAADTSGNGNNGTITSATWRSETLTKSASGTRNAASGRSAA